MLHIVLQSFGRHRSGAAFIAFNESAQVLVDKVDTQVDAPIADKHAWPGYQLLHFMLVLAAERTMEELLLRGSILRAGGRAGTRLGRIDLGRQDIPIIVSE